MSDLEEDVDDDDGDEGEEEGDYADEEFDEDEEDDEDDMDDDDDEEEKEFLRLCQMLRVNNPEIDRIDRMTCLGLPDGCGRRLGEALLGNNCVTCLDVDLNFLFDDDNDIDAAFPLAQYLRSSPAFKTVALCDETDDPMIANIVDFLVNAMGESRSIESLEAQTLIPVSPLANLLQRTTSIKELFIYLYDFDQPSTRRLVTDAFASNQTLENLFLTLGSGENGNLVVEAVLPALISHPKIREITLKLEEVESLGQCHALAHFLRATKTLEHLCLQKYSLDRKSLKNLFEAIQSNPVVSKVSLVGCVFDVEATRAFIRFIRDKKHGQIPVVRELSIQPTSSTGLFHGSTIGKVAASMLRQSSLEAFELGEGLINHVDLVGFFRSLASHASKVGLSSLQIGRMFDDGVLAMARFLPMTTALRVLVVSRIDRTVDRALLLRQMRKNGSLHHVDISCLYDEEYIPFFDNVELVRLKAYLTRNQDVPALLAKPCLYNNSNAHEESMNEGEVDTQKGTFADLNMFPSLYSIYL